MKFRETPKAGSYESTLTEEQRTSLHALLVSGITLAEARDKALPWPSGLEKGNKPSTTSLWRIQMRLQIRDRVLKIEAAAATARVTQKLLNSLVNRTDQEKVLDQAMTLIGQQVIDAGLDLDGPSSKTASAWLLLRRADQRRFDRRAAILEAQTERVAKLKSESEAEPAVPALSDEEKERKWRQIFGMQPL